jgi:hypothetical protein
MLRREVVEAALFDLEALPDVMYEGVSWQFRVFHGLA